jgi:hypothetical protein
MPQILPAPAPRKATPILAPFTPSNGEEDSARGRPARRRWRGRARVQLEVERSRPSSRDARNVLTPGSLISRNSHGAERQHIIASPPSAGLALSRGSLQRRGRAATAERLLLAWTGLRCRHGRATEGVACGRPRVRSRPWRRLSPRPDGEDRERRRSQLVFVGRRALSCTRERDRQD